MKKCRWMRNALVLLFLVPLLMVLASCKSDPDVEYKLTIVGTEGGSVTAPGEGTFTYKAGTEVDLAASPDKNYEFAGWSGDVGTVAEVYNGSTTVIMKGDYTIAAEFALGKGEITGPPEPPKWNPQQQALLPDREFDTNWMMISNWYAALHRGISAIWTGYDPVEGYIESPLDANESTLLGLSAGHPPGPGPRLLRCTFAKNLPGGVALDLLVRLYDGDTLVEEWIEEDIPDTWTVREFELSSEPRSWEDLRVELARRGETTAPASDLRQVLVSLVEMEIPYPETFLFPYLNPATTTQSPGRSTVLCPPGVQEGDLIFVCSFNGEAAEGFELIYSQPTIKDASQPYELRTWWKRAGAQEPASYTFPQAEGLWAARISGAGGPVAAAGHLEPSSDGFMSPLGIATPSVDAPENSLILRISANSGYITWTEPHQWLAWDKWPCTAASWRFQREAGPSGEEYHGTGSFIHWVAQTIAIAPK